MAILAACLLGGLPFAATAANSGGTVEEYNGRFYRYVGDGSGDVIIESENDTYGGNPVTLQSVFGGRQGTGDVEDRTIIIGDATHEPNILETYGGLAANGSANNNTLTFQNGTITSASSIFGGWGNNVAERNTVTITGKAKADGDVLGGLGPKGASWNTVNIEGSATVGGTVWGGRSGSEGVAEHNTVAISGGSVGGDVIGGYGGYGRASTSWNTVNIDGGNFTAATPKVYGGYARVPALPGVPAGTATVTDNTVTLGANLDATTLQKAQIYGGYAEGGGTGSDAVSGNTLKVESKNLTVGGVQNFEILAFTLPDTFNKNTDTMLSVGGGADLPASATSVSVMVAGTQAPALNAGDEITLISAGTSGSGTLTITPTLIPATAASYVTVGKDSTGKKLIATALTNLAALPAHAVYGSTPQGGEVTCDQPKVTEGIGATTCTATASAIAAAGATFDPDSMTVSSGTGTLINCRENTCTLTGVTSEVTVTATFTLNEYSVSDATPTGAGGTMVCPTSKVTYFDTPTCTAKPEQGYVFDKAMGISPAGAATVTCDDSGCTLTNVVNDVTVTGVFKREDYNINDITDRAKGWVSCTPNPVQYGDSTQCKATPARGHVFDGTMTVTGATLGTCDAKGCELTNATGAVTVEGHFSKEEYAITDNTDPATGSVTCTPNPVPYGETVTCTAAAKAGYIYDEGSIRLANGSAAVNCGGDTCTLTNVTSALTVSAMFTKEGSGIGTGCNSGCNGGGFGGGGGDSSSPTMGELGLLLSGLALAGAAAPALRRRERKARKHD